MKKAKSKIVKYIVISVAVLATVAVLMFNSGIAFLQKVSGVVVMPIMEGADYVFDSVGNFFASFGQRTNLSKELEQAKEKLAQLENIQSVADEVKAENERLLALFDESEKYPEFTYEYAKVVMRSVDDYSATFTLNKGSNDGIEQNMVVVAEGGLAGKIVSVTEQNSILLAVIDARCGVPALAEASRDTGVVKGVTSAGSTQGYCTMSDLPTNAIVKPGDTVITSGLGEVFPKGIKIGTITEVSKGSTSQLNSVAKVSPAVDFDHLESVLIVTGTGE